VYKAPVEYKAQAGYKVPQVLERKAPQAHRVYKAWVGYRESQVLAHKV
jgi:hypothetical protein